MLTEKEAFGLQSPRALRLRLSGSKFLHFGLAADFRKWTDRETAKSMCGKALLPGEMWSLVPTAGSSSVCNACNAAASRKKVVVVPPPKLTKPAAEWTDAPWRGEPLFFAASQYSGR